ncbi:hypothetical protein QM334_38610, partial [Burkholderia cenocepacia]|nr:hypothetical protein [Burkholderia cenocepacia]
MEPAHWRARRPRRLDGDKPVTTPVTVGVIANPASGRDIRRLTTHASVFPTAEKANMIARSSSVAMPVRSRSVSTRSTP